MSTARPTKSVTLDTPITRGETKIDAVTVRKPTSGELRGLSLQALGQSDVTALLTLIPRISNPSLANHEVDALEPEDLTKFGEVIFDFFLTPDQRTSIRAALGN